MSLPASDHVHAIPPVPEDAISSTAQLLMRFEDVAQDGRLFATALFPGLGPTAWQALMAQPEAPLLFKQGVLPILTRVVLDCTESDGPFGVEKRMQVKGALAFAHVASADPASAERIYLSMWLDAEIPIGRTNLPPPDDAGRVVRAGRMFAEHTLTRPFAAPEDRRVTRLDAPGVNPIPGQAVVSTRVADCATPPLSSTGTEATYLGDWSFDEVATVFGVCHTDSNQHVNSIAYIRSFEEAALRELTRQGRATGALLVRRATVGYRKPCFAGDRVRIAVRTFELDGKLGAVGAFLPASAADPQDRARAHAFLCARF